MRRHFTYANVVSLVVIVFAFGGTAFAAARIYTGANIKDATIASIDVKNGSLAAKDIAAASHASMRGRKGPTGPTGVAGGTGPQGDTGKKGNNGEAAHSLIRHASFVSDLIKYNTAGGVTNDTAADWYAPLGEGAGQYSAYTGSGAIRPNLNESVPTAVSPIDITFNEPVLVALTGQNQVTTGTIKPRGQGLLTATATLTVLHQDHAMAGFYGPGQSMHGRIRCKLRYANNGEPIGAGSSTLGSAEWVSSFQTNRLSTFTFTGSEPINADLDTNYNVGVSCADVDQTNSTQWVFVGGSVSAHAIWVGPS